MSGGGGPLGGLGLLVVLPDGGCIMFGLTDVYSVFGSTAAGLCFTFKTDGAALYTGGSSGALTCCDVLAAIMLPIRPVRVASCMLNCCSSEGGAEDDDDEPLPESSCCIS